MGKFNFKSFKYQKMLKICPFLMNGKYSQWIDSIWGFRGGNSKFRNLKNWVNKNIKNQIVPKMFCFIWKAFDAHGKVVDFASGPDGNRRTLFWLDSNCALKLANKGNGDGILVNSSQFRLIPFSFLCNFGWPILCAHSENLKIIKFIKISWKF